MRYEVAKELESLMGFPKELVLVDMSFLIHRSFYAHQTLSIESKGETIKTGDIYGCLSTIQLLANRLPKAAIILCMDSLTSFRKGIFSEYKSNRVKHPEIYSKIGQTIESASLLPNVYAAGCENFEADDVIYTLAIQMKPHFQRVLILSADNDIYQAIGDTVYAFEKVTNGKPELVDEVTVRTKWGVSPKHLAFFRSFKGDTSDNIEGYSRIPTAFVVWVVENWKDPEEFISHPMEENPAQFQKWVDKIRKEPEVLRRNYGLIKLSSIPGIQIWKVEGSWNWIDFYQMKATKKRMEEILSSIKDE